MEYKCLRKDLFKILQQKTTKRDKQKECLLNYLIAETKVEESEENVKQLKRDVTRFCSELFRRLDNSGRTIDRFYKNNEQWLNKDFICKFEKNYLMSSISKEKRRKDFEHSSSRSKRRKTEVLRQISESAELLTFAAGMKYREEGNNDSAKLLSEMQKSPTRSSKIRSAWKSATTHPSVGRYNDDNALTLFLEADLTKHQYNLMRHGAKNINADIYPSYKKILNAKKKCYPESIIVTETSAQVKLQDLLDHTATRLSLAQEPVISSIEENKLKSLILLSKWGCDGSSGHSLYKQKAEEEDFSDSDIFFISLVPVQLFFINEKLEKIILWQNPKPSSTLYCRPIKLYFKKETSELVKEEVAYVENQIKCLKKTTLDFMGKKVEINHDLMLTMVDGKVCNAITSTSSQTCYVCGATPKIMNQLDILIGKEVDTSTFRFGLSTLHAWIRFFEFLLHVSYRLEVKEWQIRGKEKKEIVSRRKTEIQRKFRTELGLLVDQPKPGGSGTTNDGNTARRFFENKDAVADITGINKELIHRCGVILKTMSCGFEINTDAFDKYAKSTAQLFINLYPWYYMPASVHKILLHGAAIISAALIPIGQMSEEAQEARNKHLKQFRRHHARKISRKATNIDVINLLLATSDPFISSLRQQLQTKIKRTNLSADIIALLNPEINLTVKTSNVPDNSDDSE